jgi:hypothetical protein
LNREGSTVEGDAPRIHPPGSLQIQESYFLTQPPDAPPDELAQLAAAFDPSKWSEDLLTGATTPHIASPDVHVDPVNRQIVMYFHGLEGLGRQVTRVATSRDGIRFQVRPEVLGRTYMRAFKHDGYTFAMAMPGQFYRSRNGLSGFEEGTAPVQPGYASRGALETW